MYLSQLTLNPRSRQVQREIANPYEMHRTIMQAFPDRSSDGPGRVLFRLDTMGRLAEQKLVVLVQSEKEPDWPGLPNPEGYLLSTFDPNPSYKEFQPQFTPGQRLYFRLRANPTRRLMRDIPERKLKKGQRIGLFEEKEQLAWLQRKAGEGGFTVLETQFTGEGFSGGKTKENQSLKLFAVRFEGLLQVADPDRFLQTLSGGIGSGKGFGFGLLSVARAS